MSDFVPTSTVELVLTKRVRTSYSEREKQIIKNKKSIILLELEGLELNEILIIHENQALIGHSVNCFFANREIVNIMVVAKTQSGKTGSMCATIQQFLKNEANIIPIENIYIITGVSSCEWLEQTRERMPASIQARVFHRSKLPKTFADEIRGKKNVLIIMDEIQVAAKKGQTIYKAFENAGFLNRQYLYENDIKILEYTATPDGTIYDLMGWGSSSKKILAQPGEGYIGAYDLFTTGRVKQCKDLSGYNKDTGLVNPAVLENIEEIKDDVEDYPSPLYHLIRTRVGPEQDITLGNFKEVFGEEDYAFIKYDGLHNNEVDINEMLRQAPQKHTFIFIKEMLRCAKTLHKAYCGIVYERYSANPDDAAVIQGLIGRLTGYDDNGFSICYTNIDTVLRYEELWNSEFDDKSIKWKSKTTKFTNGLLTGINTFNDPDNYDNMSEVSNISLEEEDEEVWVEKKPSQMAAKIYYNDYLKERMAGRGPNTRKPNSNGFYEATMDNDTRVYTCDEIWQGRKRGFNSAKSNYRYYPCYKDPTDKSTLEWWLIYYSNSD